MGKRRRRRTMRRKRRRTTARMSSLTSCLLAPYSCELGVGKQFSLQKTVPKAKPNVQSHTAKWSQWAF